MPSSTRRYDLISQPLERFSRTLPGVLAGDVDAIHRARVASRRLREVVPVLQLEPDTALKLARRLRRITRKLGAVRELDVLNLLLDQLQESGRHDAAVLRLVRTEIQTERDRVQRRLDAADFATELRRTVRRLSKVADELMGEGSENPRARGWRWALEARVAVRAAMLKKAIASAGALYLPERLHWVRIAAKKLRYAVELSAHATQRPETVDLQTLRLGQEQLGRMHDLQVLIDHVRRIQASLGPADTAHDRPLRRLVRSLEESCRRLHARYVRDRDALAAVCDRLRARALQKRPRLSVAPNPGAHARRAG